MNNGFNIISFLKGIKNPQQARQMAMRGLQKANPQIASILEDCLNQGQSPKEILTMAIQAGKVNRNQFNQFKNVINQYSRFLPFKISKQEMDELESAFGGQGNNPQSYQGFRF